MALSGKVRQQRFRQKHLQTGHQVRLEFRVSAAQAQAFRTLAAQWHCSLTEAFTRAVALASAASALLTAQTPPPEPPAEPGVEQSVPASASDAAETPLAAVQSTADVGDEKNEKTPPAASQRPLKPKLYPSGVGYGVWVGEIIAGSVEKQGRHWVAFASGRRPLGPRYASRKAAVSALLDHAQAQGLFTPAPWKRHP